MSSIIEKYSRALKLYRDDGISVPVLPSEMRTLIADFLALKEQCAALESREVCTVAHENVETCGYCQRDALQRQNQHLLTVTKQQGRRIESMEARLAEVEALLQEIYDGRQSLMSIGLVYRIGHTLNHRPADRASAEAGAGDR